MAALPNLDTRSILNVVEENFQKVGLKAYPIRMIYGGEHLLPREELIKQFKKTVHGVNSGYCEIHIHGLLLVYDSYFIHILEGSEDTVHRQLRFLMQREIDWIEEMKKLDEEAAIAAAKAAEEAAAEGLTVILEEDTGPKPERNMFKRLKIMMVYHSISKDMEDKRADDPPDVKRISSLMDICNNKLQFHNWRALTARPPSLVGKLDLFAAMSAHMEQLRIFLDKIKKLCNFANADEALSFEGLSAVDPRMEALPEVALLDFLIQSQYIPEFRSVMRLHRRVDDYCFYFESVWPLATHYTPRFLYKLKIDDSFVEPLPVMPWEMAKKEVVEDEEREEQQSVSSDSD